MDHHQMKNQYLKSQLFKLVKLKMEKRGLCSKVIMYYILPKYQVLLMRWVLHWDNFLVMRSVKVLISWFITTLSRSINFLEINLDYQTLLPELLISWSEKLPLLFLILTTLFHHHSFLKDSLMNYKVFQMGQVVKLISYSSKG